MSLQNNVTTGEYEFDEHKHWELFLKGKIGSWEQIFKRYYKDLYGYGLKLAGCPDMVKDGIQELFVILWDRRQYLDRVDSVKAYLLVSLRRSLLKKLEKQQRYRYHRSETTNFVHQMQISPEELVIRDEMKYGKLRALYQALELLPVRQKEVLYLKYFNGMSYDEMEQILSINYQSIRNHVCRGIKRLREILDRDPTEIVI